MQTMTRAARAYQSATTHRSQREQEADVFRHAIGALKAARNAGPIPRLRLWPTIAGCGAPSAI